MQVKKRKTVDMGLCRRWVQVIDESGDTVSKVAKVCNLHSTSCINEIRRYVTEPSKGMIRAVCMHYNISANYIILNIGPKTIEENTLVGELKDLRKRIMRIERTMTEFKTHK